MDVFWGDFTGNVECIFSNLSCDDYTQKGSISSDIIIQKYNFNDYLVIIMLKERSNSDNSAKN